MQQTCPIKGPAKPQPSGQAGKLRTGRRADNKRRPGARLEDTPCRGYATDKRLQQRLGTTDNRRSINWHWN